MVVVGVIAVLSIIFLNLKNEMKKRKEQEKWGGAISSARQGILEIPKQIRYLAFLQPELV